MELIKKMAGMSIDEVFGACEYARMAVLNKTEAGIMNMFSNMAEQEITHSETLYSTACSMLEKHKDDKEYESYKMLLKFVREMQVDKINDTRRYLTQAKSA